MGILITCPLFRMPQARVGNDGDDVRHHVETDVNGCKNQTTGLHHWNVTFGNVVDQGIAPFPGR